MAENTILPHASWTRSIAYTVSRELVRWVYRLGFRGRWLHRTRVPNTGPVLIVANHQSYLDPPMIGAGLKRHSAYLGRSGLFSTRFMAFFLNLYNVVPVSEDGGDIAAMRAVLGLLEQGHSVVIFPEGARCLDGEIAPFKRGAELMIKKAKCPVVPAAIDGAYQAWPRSAKRPKLFRHPVRIIYGEMIPYEALFDKGAQLGVTERLEQEVRSLHAALQNKRNT